MVDAPPLHSTDHVGLDWRAIATLGLERFLKCSAVQLPFAASLRHSGKTRWRRSTLPHLVVGSLEVVCEPEPIRSNQARLLSPTVHYGSYNRLYALLPARIRLQHSKGRSQAIKDGELPLATAI